MRKQETQLVIRWSAFVAALVVLAAASWGVVSQSEALYKITQAFRDMETIKIAMFNDAGETEQIEVRVADSEEKRIAGFADIGSRVVQRSVILLSYDRDTQIEFSMKQVVAPLDLAFIGSDGTVLEIIETEAYREEPYSFGVSFRYVLEASAGFFSDLNISNNGSKLDLDTIQHLIPSEPPPAS